MASPTTVPWSEGAQSVGRRPVEDSPQHHLVDSVNPPLATDGSQGPRASALPPMNSPASPAGGGFALDGGAGDVTTPEHFSNLRSRTRSLTGSNDSAVNNSHDSGAATGEAVVGGDAVVSVPSVSRRWWADSEAEHPDGPNPNPNPNPSSGAMADDGQRARAVYVTNAVLDGDKPSGMGASASAASEEGSFYAEEPGRQRYRSSQGGGAQHHATEGGGEGEMASFDEDAYYAHGGRRNSQQTNSNSDPKPAAGGGGGGADASENCTGSHPNSAIADRSAQHPPAQLIGGGPLPTPNAFANESVRSSPPKNASTTTPQSTNTKAKSQHWWSARPFGGGKGGGGEANASVSSSSSTDASDSDNEHNEEGGKKGHHHHHHGKKRSPSASATAANASASGSASAPLPKYSSKRGNAVPLAGRVISSAGGGDSGHGAYPLPPAEVMSETPDAWFFAYQRQRAEDAEAKEAERVRGLRQKKIETNGSVGYKVTKFFSNTASSVSGGVRDAADSHEASLWRRHQKKAKVRLAKYWPHITGDDLIAAFDAHGVHNGRPTTRGHILLTRGAFLFLGKGPEELLVVEELPLTDIVTYSKGSSLPCHDKAAVYVTDVPAPEVRPDALQLFTKGGMLLHFVDIVHPLFKQPTDSVLPSAVPLTYVHDGHDDVLHLDRFINYLDHAWREARAGVVGRDK